MAKPVLVIMAAGMGSRYGGLKQLDPVDEVGNLIIDYSIYDAKQAGFETVVFLIRPGMEPVFRTAIGDRIARQMQVAYAYQQIEELPAGFSVPERREKPWGTGHAVLSCAPVVHGPFAVINADDYYGTHAFRMLYQFLSSEADAGHYAMAGYRLQNTLTEKGSVARGICTLGEGGRLLGITERTRVERRGVYRGRRGYLDGTAGECSCLHEPLGVPEGLFRGACRRVPGVFAGIPCEGSDQL